MEIGTQKKMMHGRMLTMKSTKPISSNDDPMILQMVQTKGLSELYCTEKEQSAYKLHDTQTTYIFGGSPIIVAVPPTLLNNTSPIR